MLEWDEGKTLYYVPKTDVVAKKLIEAKDFAVEVKKALLNLNNIKRAKRTTTNGLKIFIYDKNATPKEFLIG